MPLQDFTAKLILLLASILLYAGGSMATAESPPVPEVAEDRPTVLITGANRGLGYEFARQYAADGWYVIGTARKPDEAEALKLLDVHIRQLDVTDPDSVAALADSLGDTPIDLLINNAGIFPRESRIENVSLDDYMRTLAVNTAGPMLVTAAVLPNLRSGDQKKIVNITSRLGSIELSGGGFYGYRESKAALNMFTKTLAGELGPEGFTCLALHPGWASPARGANWRVPCAKLALASGPEIQNEGGPPCSTSRRSFRATD